jgi:hypothetical protein
LGQSGAPSAILHPQSAFFEVNAMANVTTYADFREAYKKLSGASTRAMQKLTETVMVGVVPLLAYATKAKNVILSNLIPTAFAAETVTLASEPKKLFTDLKLKMLYHALGVKTIRTNDVFVLDPETAFKQGLAYVLRNLGDIPIVVLTEKGSADRVFLEEKINRQLRQAGRLPILTSVDLDEALKLLNTDQDAAAIRTLLDLKAMVFDGAHNPQATLLAERLKKNIITIDQKMFRIFLNLAGLGISKLVEQMQAEYLATAKSA